MALQIRRERLKGSSRKETTNVLVTYGKGKVTHYDEQHTLKLAKTPVIVSTCSIES